MQPDLQPSDERTALEQRLEYLRKTVEAKIQDLDDRQASTQALGATSLTVGAVVKHLAWAEDLWFQARLLGLELPEPWASAPTDDVRVWAFESAGSDSVDELVALDGQPVLAVGPPWTNSAPSMQSRRCHRSAKGR